MPRVIISDTSVLSALAEIRLLDLLPDFFGTVIITESVHLECLHERSPSRLRNWITRAPYWLEIVADPSEFHFETRSLGAGEASSITLALRSEPGAIVLIDERRGRRLASKLGLKVTGVVALIAEAGAEGRIAFEETFEQLKNTGFRVSEAVIAEARRLADQDGRGIEDNG